MSDSKKEKPEKKGNQLPKLPETSNLDLWKKVWHTDPEYTEAVKIKYNFTEINPQFQLMNATAQWGPYGMDWGFKDLKWTVTKTDLGDNIALDAVFFYPFRKEDLSAEIQRVEFPISVDMKLKPDDDCRKKLMTTARSKALSWLGFNADIFLGCWDDARYVNQMKAKFSDQDALRTSALTKINSAKDSKELLDWLDKADGHVAEGNIDATLYQELLAAIENRRKLLKEENKIPDDFKTSDEIDAQHKLKTQ